MTSPFTQFNYRDAQGRAQTARSPLPGQPGYLSSALNADGTRTAQGDAANPFRGYVGPDGGTFGGYDSVVDPTTGLTQKQYDERVAQGRASAAPVDWSRTSALGRTNVGGMGLSREATNARLAQIGDIERRMVAGETNFTDDERALLAKGTDNPFRSAADMVRLGYDTQGNRVADTADRFDRLVAAGEMTPERAIQERARYEAQVDREQNPEKYAGPKRPADPFGQFESATARNSVIKPGQDRMQTGPAAARDPNLGPMQVPPAQVNAASPPPGASMQANTADPFAQFATGVSMQNSVTPAANANRALPQPAAMGATPPGISAINGIQGVMANTLDPNTNPNDTGGNQPLNGGPGLGPDADSAPGGMGLPPGGTHQPVNPGAGFGPGGSSGGGPNGAPAAPGGAAGGVFRPVRPRSTKQLGVNAQPPSGLFEGQPDPNMRKVGGQSSLKQGANVAMGL